MATATKLEERLLVPMVREGREFYNNSLTQALRNLQSQGHEPVFMPESEFQRLLDLEDGKRVFVVDYGKLRDSKSGTLSIEQALEHPQIIPFLGGEARAEAYLQKHSKIYGDRIGIWHGDYLGNNPVWRV